MNLVKLHHVNLRTQQTDALVEWYTAVLGLTKGFRPASQTPGVWLYLGDTAVVHLVSVDGHPGAGAEADLKLEHFSFSAKGHEEFEQRLNARNERYERTEIKEISLLLYNIWDPDGNHIHVDFSANE